MKRKALINRWRRGLVTMRNAALSMPWTAYFFHLVGIFYLTSGTVLAMRAADILDLALALLGAIAGLFATVDLMTRFYRLRRRTNNLQSRAPGQFINWLAAFLFPQKVFEQVFAQQIDDMREEYFESLQAGRKWHARWVWLRGHAGFVFSIVAYVATGILKRFVDMWKMIN